MTGRLPLNEVLPLLYYRLHPLMTTGLWFKMGYVLLNRGDLVEIMQDGLL